MATLIRTLHSDLDIPRHVSRPGIAVDGAGNYDDLKRTVSGVASRGIHPAVLGGLVGLYGGMLLSFWALFALDAAIAMIMIVISVVMFMYFGLIAGGILLADSPAAGERQRSLSEFLNGSVDTYTGLISGREAAAQMLFLPGLMLSLALAIGIIARISQTG